MSPAVAELLAELVQGAAIGATASYSAKGCQCPAAPACPGFSCPEVHLTGPSAPAPSLPLLEISAGGAGCLLLGVLVGVRLGRRHSVLLKTADG